MSSIWKKSLYRWGIRYLHRSPASFAEIKLNDVGMDKTRNIGIIAHIDAGKTTTTERMLYYSGKTKRIGNVDEGDTVTDYLPAERLRGITIQSAAISIPWNRHKINIIDTPGHADFTFEVIRSLRVLDGAVTILDGVAGVESQTEKVWKQAKSLGIPRIAFVNKMDRPGAGFSRTVKEITGKLRTKVVLCNLPYFESVNGEEPRFVGVVDVLHKKLLKWKPDSNSTGDEIDVINVTEEDQTLHEVFEMITKGRESMVEVLGEYDESIIDSFLECDEDYNKIPVTILNKAIRKATIDNQITPVFCGASFRNIGVQPLMDGITNYLPSPLEANIPEVNISDERIKKKNSANKSVSLVQDKYKGLIINSNPQLTVALAFKVITHANRGVMTFFRVYSGKLYSNTTMINTRTGKKLNVRKLLLMHGDEPEEVRYIGAGNIGVLTGNEDEIVTGDTLVSHGPVKKGFSDLESHMKLLPIEVPPPLFNSGIEPLTAGDEAHMKECIKVLIREDPSLKVHVDEELGQTILGGMGELHLEIVRDRLISDMKAKVRLRDVVVSYKESILKNPFSSASFKNSEGNVTVEVEMDSFEGKASETTFAEEEGAIIFEEDNNIIILGPDSTPPEALAAIEDRRWKSDHSLEDIQDGIIQSSLAALQIGGPLYGLSLHSTVLRIKKWNFPCTESSTNLSEILDVTRRAISKYVEENESSFGVLEPYMETKVYVNSGDLGEVSHDLTQRCKAIITSLEDESNQHDLDNDTDLSHNVYLPPDYTLSKSEAAYDFKLQKVIVCETPLREMIGYLSKLRSMTQGRGTFDMVYIGMRRTTKARLDTIASEFSFM
ncbi:ribosome-releasing factor 2, mitochondrial [Scheffersomyces coipomensis]|uniref:ribosome-releasing factor 2, mitochondrial n=1 Tax=Scheffersomyces coipomensis TaxID=1788519 RepID=UPI00315DB6AE